LRQDVEMTETAHDPQPEPTSPPSRQRLPTHRRRRVRRTGQRYAALRAARRHPHLRWSF
jgi:hypothetical protein